MASEIAERYASALFSLARENHTVKEKKETAENLLSALEENDDLLLFLRAVKVTPEEKKDTIDKIFQDVLDHDMRSFLKLLVDKDRTYYTLEILKSFIDLCDEDMGIARAEVDSARPLSEEDLNRIREVLEKKSGKTIVLKNRIDPSLIAGIKVKLGYNVTDATMKRQIENMKETLLKGGRA